MVKSLRLTGVVEVRVVLLLVMQVDEHVKYTDFVFLFLTFCRIVYHFLNMHTLIFLGKNKKFSRFLWSNMLPQNECSEQKMTPFCTLNPYLSFRSYYLYTLLFMQPHSYFLDKGLENLRDDTIQSSRGYSNIVQIEHFHYLIVGYTRLSVLKTLFTQSIT